MSNLIQRLNGLATLSPDEIAQAIGDALNHWHPMPEMTQEFFDKYQHRSIAMWHERDGYYTTLRSAFTTSSSYRTRDAEAATTQSMRPYYPESARDCPGWWFIGFQYKDTPTPCPT